MSRVVFGLSILIVMHALIFILLLRRNGSVRALA
jgi:hypothetical protein